MTLLIYSDVNRLWPADHDTYLKFKPLAIIETSQIEITVDTKLVKVYNLR